jgi:hypothetical protein
MIGTKCIDCSVKTLSHQGTRATLTDNFFSKDFMGGDASCLFSYIWFLQAMTKFVIKIVHLVLHSPWNVIFK